ncbi:MAG: protein translocase SEC61 complex subunit gamma [Candidatus Diapherotrites archaeon]
MVLNYITKFRDDTKRIFTISKKPTWEEFKVMAKVTGIGILIIGIIGFFVSLIFAFIKV